MGPEKNPGRGLEGADPYRSRIPPGRGVLYCEQFTSVGGVMDLGPWERIAARPLLSYRFQIFWDAGMGYPGAAAVVRFSCKLDLA